MVRVALLYCEAAMLPPLMVMVALLLSSLVACMVWGVGVGVGVTVGVGVGVTVGEVVVVVVVDPEEDEEEYLIVKVV